MNILIGLVIAMFVIVGGYVGYHASQEMTDEGAEGHDIMVDLEILNGNTWVIDNLQYVELKKSRI